MILAPAKPELRPKTRWPDGLRGAVSLTYDDGDPSQLKWAMPALEARGLRGTFYLPVGLQVVQTRVEEWRKAFESGHEIGSHSWHHPCRRDAFPTGAPPWFRHGLEDYSLEMIEADLRRAREWLDRFVGSDPWRTFAYPCHHTTVGPAHAAQSYVPVVSRLHAAARVAGHRCNDPANLNWHTIQAFDALPASLERWERICDQALADGQWCVFNFHRLGDAPDIPVEWHARFLERLCARPVWVGPVGAVVRWLQAGQRG
jgi:peptidoglycan-N-acetylglucosamine deacetylase